MEIVSLHFQTVEAAVFALTAAAPSVVAISATVAAAPAVIP